ncbi:sulfate transporter [Kitasatospora herbaricolor]|uniref:STAS domain-containing protein n=1 Tax=Kitasatospora herbaricolor TaxID=68217 RepID=UPI00174A2EE2|nr:STAS domain-containing protein [Kitasatospora herbaricolor]MDQ0306178.1 anti-anti-sigma factor [Kitasatospora herbaricolor]GGV49487.1 sulfate transporter [Kitasatospora herbaricolor]
MTSPTPFIDIDPQAGALVVRITGELDYDTGPELLDAVATHLVRRPPPPEVRLDFAGLTWIDSTGLSTLLMVHRHTTAAGSALHLDNRPDVLERVLNLTQTLEHLTGPAAQDLDAEAVPETATGL